jgi:hypothetical protein
LTGSPKTVPSNRGDDQRMVEVVITPRDEHRYQ